MQLLNRLKSDESLMVAYRNGDAGAFETLYHRHKDGLFAFLFRSCWRHAVVEELAQDTWIAVIDAVNRYEPTAQFRTWLYKIAYNRLVDHWRRPDNRHTSLEHAPEPDSDSNSSAEHEGLHRDIMAALALLPREQKDAILLRQQDFSHAEIAAITNSNTEAVKSRLRYGRKQLRERLGEEL